MPNRLYSSLRHLAFTIWLNKVVDAPESCWMAMLTECSAYFDCSGSPDDTKALFVSGAVSSIANWLKFETEWNAVLDKYGVEKPFHMKPFMSAWRDRPKERDAILNKLLTIIRKRTRKLFLSGLLLEDWRSVNERYQMRETSWLPYPLC